MAVRADVDKSGISSASAGEAGFAESNGGVAYEFVRSVGNISHSPCM